MKIIKNCTSSENFTLNEVNQINTLLATHPRYSEHDEKIHLIIKSDLNQLHKRPKDTALNEINKGFGVVQHNYELNKKNPVHLIILNEEIITQCNIEPDEKIAIILHELGHIFNKSVDEIIPLFNEFGMDDIAIAFKTKEEVIQKNSLNKESYADDFAKQYGYGEHLITSMKKYLQYSNAKNKEMISKRIDKLRKNVELKGTFMELNIYNLS